MSQLTLASLTLCNVPLDGHYTYDIAELVLAWCRHVDTRL